MTNKTYVENIENTTNEVVAEKEANYTETVEATSAERQEEVENITGVEQGVGTMVEGITQNEEAIIVTEQTVVESLEKSEENQQVIESTIDRTYDKMSIADDLAYEWADNHTDAEKADIYNNGLNELWTTEEELTTTCDKAKEDYITLKNAVEQYGKDYDEEAYNKAIEGITIPVINVAETNTAVDNLITKLQEYPDTTEWQNALVEYKQSVEELNALNLEAMFNDLYATKDKYDELKSMKAELEAKKEELATKKAELDQMYEDLKANDAIRAEQVAQAKAELDKAMEVQENVLAGIYEKVDDPAYAEYNKSIDAYYSSLVETPKDEEQTSPKEEEVVVVIPNLDESEILKEVTTENLVVYQEVQKVTKDVPTASYSGLTGYVMSALMSLVCVVCVAKKHIMK